MRYYCYALIDPRDLSCFYIGKGKAERKFSHFKKHPVDKRKNSDKMAVIEAIEAAGLKPQATVMGWYDTEKEAYAAEKKLIEAQGLNNLTNKNKGGAGGQSTKTKGDQALTAKQEKFCQNIAGGTFASATDAWRDAYPGGKASKPAQHQMTAKLMNNPKIVYRIEELRAPVVAKTRYSLEWCMDEQDKARELALMTDQPGPMSGAVREIGKLGGHYPSEKLDVSVNVDALSVRLQQGRAKAAEDSE